MSLNRKRPRGENVALSEEDLIQQIEENLKLVNRDTLLKIIAVLDEEPHGSEDSAPPSTSAIGVQGGDSIALKKGPKISGPFRSLFWVHFLSY